MSDNKTSWYEWLQVLVLLLTMSMMLSKHYHIFEVLFKFLYEGGTAIIAVVLGAFSLLHGLFMVYKSFLGRDKIHWREFVEALIVIASGVVLLSPEFNTVFTIPFIASLENIPDDIISHLAIGLVPIIVIYVIDIIRGETD